MARIRYAKMSFKRNCSLIQPGTTTRDSRTGQRRKTPPITHSDLFCNFMVRSVNERLVTGIEINKQFATAIFRYIPLIVNVNAAWKFMIDGKEYNIVGEAEEIERMRMYRLTLERVS